MDWTSLERFPAATADWQMRSMPWSRTTDAGESVVVRVARKWTATDLRLVSTPETRRLLPAILHPRLAREPYERLCTQYTRGLVGFACLGPVAVVAVTLGFLTIGKGVRLLLLIAVATLVLAVERFGTLSTLRETRDRALFFHWTVANAGTPLAACTAFMLACALAQCVLQARYGSLPEFLWHHGLVYEHVAAGELWRLAVGPLWHSGFPHWGSNFALGLFALPMACALGQRAAYGWFLVSMLASSTASFLASAHHGIDATLGVSGGFYGLLGGACATAGLQRPRLPRSLFPWLASLTLLWMALPYLLSPNANDIGHVAGVLVGGIAACATQRRSARRAPPAAP
jgi:membrane associated rhomboid family serine protease